MTLPLKFNLIQCPFETRFLHHQKGNKSLWPGVGASVGPPSLAQFVYWAWFLRLQAIVSVLCVGITLFFDQSQQLLSGEDSNIYSRYTAAASMPEPPPKVVRSLLHLSKHVVQKTSATPWLASHTTIYHVAVRSGQLAQVSHRPFLCVLKLHVPCMVSALLHSSSQQRGLMSCTRAVAAAMTCPSAFR